MQANKVDEFWGCYCEASKLHYDKLLEMLNLEFHDNCLSGEDINFKRQNRIFFPYLISYFSLCPKNSIAGRRELKKQQIRYCESKGCWEEVS